MDAVRSLLEKSLPLDLENFLKMIVSVNFLGDGLMDSNYIWYTEMQVKFNYGCSPIIIGGSCIFLHLHLPQSCWNDFTEFW
jgi:hypothetical protein